MGAAFLAVGVLLLVAALVKGGAHPVTWLLFRWNLSKVIAVIMVLAVIMAIGKHTWS